MCPAGAPNFLDKDSDGDGISDQIECRCRKAWATFACGRADDADEDGVPNYLDVDSDSDGLLDSVEGTEDDNGNGLPNYVDPFSVSDDGQRVLIDSDDDGNPILTKSWMESPLHTNVHTCYRSVHISFKNT